MGTYAIGDVQGCYEPLRQLLDQLRFDPAVDRLVVVGDLVNRGPDSVSVLRFLRSLGDRAVCLLGNHDLHLLAVAEREDPVSRKDSFQDVLAAPDRAELLDWLRRRPLAWQDPETGTLAIHAGLPPEWDAAETLARAREAEAVIAGPDAAAFYHEMYGNEPERWDPALTGWERIRFIVNCLTRLRYCRTDGSIDLRHKGEPGSQPPGLLPWFELPQRRSAGQRVVFGHWSTLGRPQWCGGSVVGLDTGCVWGGALSALELGSGQIFAVSCEQFRRPGVHGD